MHTSEALYQIKQAEQARQSRKIRSSYAHVQPDKLEPGDLLFFRPPQIVGWKQRGIMALQSVINIEGGHYDTTHVGIVTGKNEQGEIMIAHVTEAAKNRCYVHEPLNAMFVRDSSAGLYERECIVFRSKSNELAKAIAEDAKAKADVKEKTVNWTFMSGIKSLIGATTPIFRRSQNFDPESDVSTSSICSKFVTEVLHKAIGKLKNATTTQKKKH